MDTTLLQRSKVFQSLQRLSAKNGKENYLVGGAVRDLLLGKPLGKDFDFVVQGEVSGRARAVAQEMGGHAFPLEESFGTWRVILKKGRKKTELDFSLMQGRDIFEDLRQRDFTINSMALSLEEIFHRENPDLIDPLNGVTDLRRRILRANSEESLRQDPLRMLRAFRFSSTLRFSVEDETLRIIQRNKNLILRSAWERIRREFFTALGENRSGHFLRQLNVAGLLGEIFPEVQGWEDLNRGLPNFSLLEHSFRTVDAGEFIFTHLEELYPSFGRSPVHHFSQAVEEGIPRRALFKFVAFFHDSGKPGTLARRQEDQFPRFLDHDQEGQKVNTAIAQRMKLSRRSIRIISDLTRQHMRIHSLSRAKEITPRAKYRFFQDLRKEGIDLVFLALSNALASKSTEFHLSLSSGLSDDFLKIKEVGAELLRYYYGEFTQKPQKTLLDGKEIMKTLGVPQGKAIGVLLDRLREAEVAGKVQTREEALKFLKNIDTSA